MSLKVEIAQKIQDQVLKPLKKEKEWKVLILDKLSTKIISSCCKMHDIMEMGITLVEDLYKKREVLPLEAIYLISPSEESVATVMGDFAHQPVHYAAAHVFFIKACPQPLLERFRRSSFLRYVRTMTELNIAFVAVETQVFSLESPLTSRMYNLPVCDGEEGDARIGHLEKVAEQMATLCATLGEYPIIRCHQTDKNMEFSRLLQIKLDAYKADEPTMGQGPHKDRSVLLVLDRGFDPVSPLLHELTFQAMAYDLLGVKGDVFSYESAGDGKSKEHDFLLDETNTLWQELRHKHIAHVSTHVSDKWKQFCTEKRMGKDGANNLRELSVLIKRMPQYQREMTAYTAVFRMAEDCMHVYKTGVDKLCDVEQDLAMGMTPDGEPIKDQMRSVGKVLMEEYPSLFDRLRILLLYIITKGGVSESNLSKMLDSFRISQDCTQLFRNAELIGTPIFVPEPNCTVQLTPGENTNLLHTRGRVHPIVTKATTSFFTSKPNQPYLKRPLRSGETRFDQSRWTPYVKDIMEDLIADKLDARSFPRLSGGPSSGGLSAASAGLTSARYQGNWHARQRSHGGGKVLERHTGPRLIVCVIGGVCHSEMRSAYEVTTACRESRRLASEHTSPTSKTSSAPGGGMGWNWEVIVGGSHVITPEQYLQDLLALSNPPLDITLM